MNAKQFSLINNLRSDVSRLEKSLLQEKVYKMLMYLRLARFI